MKRAARVVKPYSAFAAETFNPSTYPSCKLFLRCRETSGATLRDEVSGGTITVGASVAQSGNAVRITPRSPGQQLAENIPTSFNPAAQPMLLFAVFEFSGSGSSISLSGSVSTEHTHILIPPGLTGAHVNQDQTSGDSATITAPSGDQYGIGIMSVPGATNGEVRLFKTNGSTWETETLPVAGFTTHNAYDQLIFTSPGGTLDVYALGAYVFATPPADIKPALLWMTSMALAGTPAVYPGWAA